MDTFGKVDILVNNAGPFSMDPYLSMSEASLRPGDGCQPESDLPHRSGNRPGDESQRMGKDREHVGWLGVCSQPHVYGLAKVRRSIHHRGARFGSWVLRSL